VDQKGEIYFQAFAMTLQTQGVRIVNKLQLLTRRLLRYSCCSARCTIRMKDHKSEKCVPTYYAYCSR